MLENGPINALNPNLIQTKTRDSIELKILSMI